MGFLAELKRRNVTRVAGVYIVAGWILVQVATALEESINLPAWFDGLIVALLLIGLPIAVIFAWAFELTPEGVVRTEAVPEGASITGDTGRKLDYALAFGMVALVIVIIWQQATVSEPVPLETAAPTATVAAAGPSDASVAVLPFSDMSSAGDQEYFSDGLSEEILNLLVRADAIEVVSRTSSFQFKNTTLGIPEIASELNVRHIVEGSVRKSGETIRVTAQLIDAVTDRHLWSDTYDRPLTVENLFEIQDDVANSIFEALSAELGFAREIELRAKRITENVDAYGLFLQARTLYQSRRDLDQVDELLAEAVRIDPEFSEAWAHKAANQDLMFSYGYSDLSAAELNRRGLEEAEMALSLDPDSATALAAIGTIYASQRTYPDDRVARDWEDILALYDKALALDPRNPNAYNWRGLAYAWLGRLDLAIADFERCNQFEPFYVPCVENLHWWLAVTGRDDEAMAIFKGNLDAGLSKIIYTNLPLLVRLDEELLFKAATNNVSALRDWRYHDELYRAYKNPAGDHSKLAQSINDFMKANPGRDKTFSDSVLLALGHPVMPRNAIGVWDSNKPGFRQSTHFKKLMRHVGAVDYWKTKGLPSFCRWLEDDDFECD